jgi:cation:H+ antiporter
MSLLLWLFVFLISLFALVKGSGLFVSSAERIGLYLGFSPFAIGVVIIGLGTSLPEFASSIAAVLANTTEIVTANVVGSNIANILLIGGILAVVGRRIVITRDLLRSELTIFVVSTALFLGIIIDGSVTFVEAVLLVAGLVIYVLYSIYGDEDIIKSAAGEHGVQELKRDKPDPKVLGILIVGLIGLLFGAKYLVESVIELSVMLNIAPGLITVTAVAIGTSLPELVTSLRALFRKQTEMAIGNIFGSNAFNILMVAGVAGLFSTLATDEKTFTIGIPILAVASFILLISGISRRIYRWEGFLFLIFYLFFIFKLFGL